MMHRRRFIQIMATSAAGLCLGSRLSAQDLQPVHWQGYAMGAEGQFTLYTHEPLKAKKILAQCFTEIRRLESIFSLYDSQSELSQLNREGYLKKPSSEWQPLLQAIEDAHSSTGGLFDPTVQPLWKAYEAHFNQTPEASSGLPTTTLSEALAKTGWAQVEYSRLEIRFARPDMSLTLNGIAQGFITDRVTTILKEAGYSNVLIELGETRALGPHPEQRPWQIGIKKSTDGDQLFEVAEIENQALATSGSYGSPFSKDGQYHHLIHPKSGLPTTQWKSLSVIAPTATEADALSTGLSFATEKEIQDLLSVEPELQVLKQA